MRATDALLLPALAVLAACASPAPQAATTHGAAAHAGAAPAPIDAAALHALYAMPHREDGTVLHGSHAGAEWTKWAKPDGSMELLAGHGLFATSGTYVLHGNAICTAWRHIDHGKQNCMHLVRVGADEYVSYDPDGTPGSRFKVKPK